MAHDLYFIRHGQTDWNNQARLQGQTDTDINTTGRAQAERNGARLRDLLIDRYGSTAKIAFIASPLRRTRQTMELVLAACALPVDSYDTHDALREISFGDWEGMTRPEINETQSESYAQYRADRWSYRPPNAESYQDLSKRVLAWLEARDGPTVCVSHGGCLRVIQGHLHATPTHDIPRLQIPQDQIFTWVSGETDWQ